MAPPSNTCVVADIEIDCHGDIDGALDSVIATDGVRPGWVLAMNPEKIVAARRDPSLSALLSSASIRIADGIGLVWVMRRRGCRSAVRIPGIEFWLGAMDRAAKLGASVFLLGGRDGVAARAADELERRFPGLRVVGVHHGFLDEQLAEAVESDVAALQPDIVVVAMGSPRQEREIERLRVVHPEGLYLGVGGGFDVVVGDVSRAPRFALKYNVEWLWRMLRHPSRLWRYRSLATYLYLTATKQV